MLFASFWYRTNSKKNNTGKKGTEKINNQSITIISGCILRHFGLEHSESSDNFLF